ncbi:hypothetical protein C5748_03845 [Phyllobacterium phragmitis]|uniref:Uncharacterized protein n=1 Tax=Phyllobacterium phragmitis TaxID=2670329 RepID=A0A2S9IXU0_9HYPH|nr:hypothetical protein [Phyllobacterium phragmitis]PRD45337.1 hypothetical protein C5748_03845 [Phyllobacterium phragmitis]
MKFKLVDKYAYWWPVKVSVPDPDRPGKFLNQTFDMKFEALSKSEADAMSDDFMRLESDEERVKQRDNMLYRICKDWRGVQDDDDKSDVPFSDATFAQAMQWSWFRTGVYVAFSESLAGEQARKGN